MKQPKWTNTKFFFHFLVVAVVLLSSGQSCQAQNCPNTQCACIDYGDGTIYINCASLSLTDSSASTILNAFLANGISPVSYLYIPSNQLTKVPDQVKQFTGLIGADMPGNKITTLPANSFYFNGKFARIYLPLNTLNSISAGAFQGNGYGENTWIFLYNNQLTRFESGVFQSVLQQMATYSGHPNTFIDIGNNPIDCTNDPCHLAWLLRDNRNLLKNVYRGVCSNGVAFENVNQNIFSSCSGTSAAPPTCPPYDPNIYTCTCSVNSCQLNLIPTTTPARPTCPAYDPNVFTCTCGVSSCQLNLIPTTTTARPTCPPYDPNVYTCTCGATSCQLNLIPTTTPARPTCPAYDPNVYTCTCGVTSCQLNLIPTTTAARPTCPPYDPNIYTCVCGVSSCQLQLISTTARPLTCPPYDPSIYICVCGTSTCQLQPIRTPPPGSFFCPTPDGLFPNPSSCSNFYACSNGNPYLMECAPTAPGDNKLAFNPKTLECDYPENVPGCSIIKN